ncbi:hypothetical protein K788_0004440 [Paraburkholderia caribensis MBA4]|uniref:Uncharacterized protein n=1 Tax=Paraburkholderia caribensis MBA4 TaxID=1323664 RepID=A0A0P0RA97_9BURK|nr:hypothetical protein K788_0004440 [Paraburkholderia caribensis MBA4]
MSHGLDVASIGCVAGCRARLPVAIARTVARGGDVRRKEVQDYNPGRPGRPASHDAPHALTACPRRRHAPPAMRRVILRRVSGRSW